MHIKRLLKIQKYLADRLKNNSSLYIILWERYSGCHSRHFKDNAFMRISRAIRSWNHKILDSP